jgi:hypothetical protein
MNRQGREELARFSKWAGLELITSLYLGGKPLDADAHGIRVGSLDGFAPKGHVKAQRTEPLRAPGPGPLPVSKRMELCRMSGFPLLWKDLAN